MTHTNCWLYLMYCKIRYLFYLHPVKVQLSCTQLEDTQFGVISRCPFCSYYIVAGFQFHHSAALSPVPIEYYGRESAGAVATRSGLGGPGIEFRCVQVYRVLANRPWVPPRILHNAYRSFPWAKRPERGVDNPSPSSAEVKKRIQLHLYSPSVHLWPLPE